jgi:glutaconate CoA-transferase subunit B
VITNLGILRFDAVTRRMVLDGFFDGVTPQQILDHMSFSVDIEGARVVPPPTEKELNILRKQCDPQRLILG